MRNQSASCLHGYWTGKTFVLFKLSGNWLNPAGYIIAVGNLLGFFLADRLSCGTGLPMLLSAFSSSQSDPRFLFDGQKKLNLNRDLYYAIYQSLWNDDNRASASLNNFPKIF